MWRKRNFEAPHKADIGVYWRRKNVNSAALLIVKSGKEIQFLKMQNVKNDRICLYDDELLAE